MIEETSERPLEGWARVRDTPDFAAALRGGLTKPLSWMDDPRGSLIEIWRATWDQELGPFIANSGIVRQAYLSTVRPGVIKAWHLHTQQTDRFVVLRGAVLVVMASEDGQIEEQVLTGRQLRIVPVAPRIAHGWMCLGQEEATVLNLCSHEYDGTDEYRRGAHEGPWPGVPYDWRVNRDG